MILETERLYLRRLEQMDFGALCEILQDEACMYAYEGAFSDAEVQEWLDRQLARYEKWDFGLWAVILKQTGKLIGQCGLTMQPWVAESGEETEVLEIGYWPAKRMHSTCLARKRYARSSAIRIRLPEMWHCATA